MYLRGVTFWKNLFESLEVFLEFRASFLVLVLFFSVFLSVFPSAAQERASSGKEKEPGWSKPISLYLPDLPDVQYLGYFSAVENGFFQARGLPQIRIVSEDSYIREEDLCGLKLSREGVEALARQDVDFVDAWMAEGVRARCKGLPIVAIARIPIRSSACFIVRTDLDPTLKSIEDLRRETVAVWEHNEATPSIFMFLQEIPIEVVRQRGWSNVLFNEGVVNVGFSTLYSYAFLNQYTNMRSKIRVFHFSDYGCAFPENTIFCQKSFLLANPELCHQFVLAVFEGWQWVFTHQQEAIELLAKYRRRANISDDLFQLDKRLEIWKSLFDLDPMLENNGYCDKLHYDMLINAMMAAGLNQGGAIPEFESFFYPAVDLELIRQKLMKSAPGHVKKKGEEP